MASVLDPQSTFKQNQATLEAGTDPISLGSGSAPTRDTSSSSMSSPALGSGGTTLSSQTSSATPSVPKMTSFQTHGSMAQRLFDPGKAGVRKGGETLSGARSLFQTQAGPARSYESIGAQGTLQAGVESDEGVEGAKNLLTSKYSGPSGMNDTTMAGLQNLYGDMQARNKALQSGSGLMTLLQQSAPGLSLGEARFEAKKRLSDSDYKKKVFTPNEELKAFGYNIGQQSREAEAYATARQQQEADIAQRSRDYLTGSKTTINASLKDTIDAHSAQQAEAASLYEKLIRSGGSVQDLKDSSQYLQSGSVNAPGDMAGMGLADLFSTPTMKRKREADAEYERIMGQEKYKDLADIDLRLGLSNRGFQSYQVDEGDYTPGDWLGAGDMAGGRPLTQDQADRLHERQKELEAVFGDSGGSNRVRAGGVPQQNAYESAFGLPAGQLSQDPELSKATTGAKYRDVRPLYDFGAGDYQREDLRGDITFDRGMSATRESISTEKQRDQFNRINNILGEVERLAEADPARAATMFADIDSYLERENATLKSRKEKLDKNQKAWANHVAAARRKVRKAKKKAKLGKVLGYVALGAVASGGAGLGLPVDYMGLGYKATQDTYKDVRKDTATSGGNVLSQLQS